jgi:cell division transport system permease protein
MKKPPSNKPNYLYTIVSVTLVLFLLGLFGLLVVQGQQFIKTLKEQVEIIVEFQPETAPAGVDSLQQFLTASDFFKPNSAQFISKEDGTAMMREEFGEEFLKLDMANPLYDVLIFNVRSDWMEPDSMRQIRDEIKTFTYVNDVYYQESVTDAIAQNLRTVSLAVLAAGVFFIIVAIALILNTIRLALYANRFLIKNMELVGASWGFISRPYLTRSFWHGLICGLLAIGALSLLLYMAVRNGGEMQDFLDLQGIAVVFGGLLLLGIFITTTSTYYVVKKYLKMRVDDLY